MAHNLNKIVGNISSFFFDVFCKGSSLVRSTVWHCLHFFFSFYVLLTVHLSVFILVINQLDAQNLFYNKFISCLYMFRAPCVHRQEVKIVLYSLWYHHTYRCGDTRVCIIHLMHKICVTISLFHASTFFEHHVFIVRRSKLYYTASGFITPIGVVTTEAV